MFGYSFITVKFMRRTGKIPHSGNLRLYLKLLNTGFLDLTPRDYVRKILNFRHAIRGLLWPHTRQINYLYVN